MLKKWTKVALLAVAALIMAAGTFISCSDGDDGGSGRKTVAQFESDEDGMRMTFYDDKSFEIATAQAEAARATNFNVIITGYYEGNLTGKVTIKDVHYSDGSPVYVTVTISGNILALKIYNAAYTLTKNGSTTKPGNGDDDGEDSDNGDEPPVTGGITDPAGNLTIVDGVVTSCRKEAEGTIVIPDGVTGIQGGSLSSAFWERKGITEVVIPDSVTSIGMRAFYKCISLKKVTIGNRVSSISNGAFYGCSALESVEIPDSVTTIGKEAFYQCNTLASVVIGNGVTTIEKDAFYQCKTLANVVIGNGVTTIGDHAFYDCRALTNVVLPASVRTIGNSAFESTRLESVTLPDGVETISDHAFQDCDTLTNVVLPASVRTIGNYAFDNTRLESVTLPDGVETIGYAAFRNTSSSSELKSIKIPASVKFIGNGAGVFNMTYDTEVEFAVTTGWYYNENYDYEEKDNEEDWLPVADYVDERYEDDWETKPEAEKLMYLFNNTSALKRK